MTTLLHHSFPRPWAGVLAFATLVGLVVPPRALAGPAAKSPMEPAGIHGESSSGRDRFHFSAGWMWRETGGAKFRSGSRSQQLSLPQLFGAASTTLPQIGAPGEDADRFYADGSVRVDTGTAFDGTTSAWSYQKASQVADGSLHYHDVGRRREFEASDAFRTAEDSEFDGRGGAPVMELGWDRELTPHWFLGARFQWSFLDLDGAQTQSNFASSQHGREATLLFKDSYDLQGVIPPQAPYDGAGLGFGPVINNRPTTRQMSESASGASDALFFNRLHQSFEIKLHTISLGPALSGRVGPVSILAGTGVALHILDWEAAQQETLYLRRDGGRPREYHRWNDRSHDTALLPGFYLQGAIAWQVTSHLFVSGFGRYDWSERLHEHVGPSTLSFDPGGWSAGVSLGFAF